MQYIFHDRQQLRSPLSSSLSPAMKKNTKSDPLGGLSAREREVLKLVVEGRTSKEIAASIGVKPASVYTYRSRIMTKLDINDIASLVRLAIRQGVIKP